MYSKRDLYQNSDALLLRMLQLLGALQGVIDMGTEIVSAYFFDKSIFFHDMPGLFVDMGEDQLNALFLTVFVELLQVVHGGCINCADASHAQDETAAFFV